MTQHLKKRGRQSTCQNFLTGTILAAARVPRLKSRRNRNASPESDERGVANLWPPRFGLWRVPRSAHLIDVAAGHHAAALMSVFFPGTDTTSQLFRFAYQILRVDADGVAGRFIGSEPSPANIPC